MRPLAALSFTLAVAASALTHAQTFQTWRGENTQNNWHNSTAWWNFPNNSTIVFGQQEWDNNVELTQNNNNGGGTFSTWRWLYKGGANLAHTFTGDPVRFFDFGGQDPAIQNDSSATHVINMAISGDGDAADPLNINLNGAGGLTFGGPVNNQGATINIGGTAGSAVTVRFNDVVSGAGGMYLNNTNATVLFDATNTMSGQLTIHAGTARLNAAGDTFGTSSQAIRIGTGASLDLNGVNTSVGSVAEEGSNDGGSISLGSGVLTVTGANTGSLFQSNISGSGGLTMAGSGTTSLSLYGTQSYSGATTVSGGTLTTAVPLASSSFSLAGGSFGTSAANLIPDAAAFTLGGGSFNVGGNETFGNNGVTLAAGTTSTISAATATTITIGGALSGSGNLIKAGAGSLQLNAAGNTFSGGTTINAGTLIANAPSALGSGAITVASGATLQLREVLANAITNAGTLSFAGGGISRTSTAGQQTVATLVAGTSSLPVALSPAIAWLTRPQNTFSDALDLSGTSGTVQILQLSYDPGVVGSVAETDLQLGWNSGGTWVNAVNGNTGSAGGSALTNQNASYTSIGITPTTAFLGSWGRDTTTNVVWAVVDHNSDFVVIAVPEPEVGLAAALGLATLLVGGVRAARRTRGVMPYSSIS